MNHNYAKANVTFQINNKKEKHGEYKEVHWQNQNKACHCLFNDGRLHGEYIEWDAKGKVTAHRLYDNGEPVELNLPSLSDEDRFELILTHNVPLLPEWSWEDDI